MPSTRRQFNCRPEPSVWDRIERVRVLVGKSMPFKLSDSELLAMAMAALERELNGIHGGDSQPTPEQSHGEGRTGTARRAGSKGGRSKKPPAKSSK